MFRSLKLQINLFAFLPFVFMAVVGMYIQITTLGTINHHVSDIAEEAVLEVEKRRLVTVIDSSLSLLQPYLDKPGKEGLEDGLKMLYNYRFDNGIGYLFSYDKDGTRVMSGSNQGVGKNFINAQDKKGNYIVQNILKAAQSGGDFTTYYFPKKGETEPSAKYSYSVWIEQWGIAIATGFFIDGTEEILSNIDATLAKTQNESIIQNLLTVLIVSVIVALCVFFSVRMILTALGSLRQAVEGLADGEGDLTTKLPGSSLDILDDIARHFNRFLAAMAEDINNLQNACSQLNEIALESRKQNDSLTQSSDQQVQETSYIAAAVEEMSSTALEIAENADNTRASAEQTEQEVQDVLKQVQVSSDELNLLSNVLLNVEDSVQELGGNVEEINSVLSVIQGISEQTNLLALNAAIEAARAGELGRGFAVVADEVRNLAQRSQESTQEIQIILEKLQSSAEKTIQDMSHTTEKRTAVVEAMEKITNIIDSSSESIKSLTVMNVDVSNAATQQSTVVNDMAKNINGIADLAEVIGKNSSDAKTQFNRLEEQAHLVQTVTNKFKT